MGGDPIPGPHDFLVEWFEAWKATLTRVKPAPGKQNVEGPVPVTRYLHGSPSMRRRS